MPRSVVSSVRWRASSFADRGERLARRHHAKDRKLVKEFS
jgi:hypothetical protein